jgi:hypothetical protein
MCRLISFAIIAIIFLTMPATAQDPCGDLNCNGYCLEISDLGMALQIIGSRCSFDSIQQCTLDEGDVDEDGYFITIADAMFILFVINELPLPDFSRHPNSDTVKMGSAIAAPGETVELPIYIKTIDTVTAFQLSIETDTSFVTVDTLVFLDSIWADFSYCSGHIYAACFDEAILFGDSVTLLPGEYHIADLIVTVNPEIEEPDSTQIVFSNDPEQLQYTAFSNVSFFTPVTVDGEIQIITTGIENGEYDNIPGNLSINAYPNPFNAYTMIDFGLPEKSHVTIEIFDLLGRKIETLFDGSQPAGYHSVTWNSGDYSSGIYFCRIEAGDFAETRKMILLK